MRKKLELVKPEPKPKRVHPVRQRLKEMDKTMTWLAEQIGLSTRSIQRTLKGEQRMNNSDYRKMLRILGMTENDYWNVGPRRKTMTDKDNNA